MLGCGRSAVTAIQGPPRTASRATWANEHSFALLSNERAGATAPAGIRVALTMLLVPVTAARLITLQQKLFTQLLIGRAAAVLNCSYEPSWQRQSWLNRMLRAEQSP